MAEQKNHPPSKGYTIDIYQDAQGKLKIYMPTEVKDEIRIHEDALPQQLQANEVVGTRTDTVHLQCNLQNEGQLWT